MTILERVAKAEEGKHVPLEIDRTAHVSLRNDVLIGRTNRGDSLLIVERNRKAWFTHAELPERLVGHTNLEREWSRGGVIAEARKKCLDAACFTLAG